MPKYCFGKHPAKHDYRTLRFRNYVTPELAESRVSRLSGSAERNSGF
jgi:hypothetical protein